MVGAEKNTTDVFDSTETDPNTGNAGMQNHDVYAQGEFKDDQIQNITGSVSCGSEGLFNGRGTITAVGAFGVSGSTTYAGGDNADSGRPTTLDIDTSRIVRAGTTTHGKRKAVYVYIKAVDGVDISDEGTFLVTVKNFVDEKLARAESYSAEEQWTGGYWIDGKKIYRKVVDCGALPNNTTKTVAHNIANIDWVVKYNGMASDGNEWLQLPASYYSNSAIGLSVNYTNISLRPYTNRTTYTTTLVTIEYTKTTD